MSIAEAAGIIGWFAVGAIGWTLLEWVLHGQLFHARKFRNPFAKEHALHHATPSYIAGWPRKIFALVIVVAVLATLLQLPLGLGDGAAIACGFGVMYIAYESLHRTIHRRAPRTSYGRWVRLHHVQHHFHTPQRNYGVTTPVWDLAFGTYVPFETPLAVPERHVLPWMLDPDTGLLAAIYEQDYVVVRRVRDARDSAVPAAAQSDGGS